MGPQLYRCGNHWHSRYDPGVSPVLQWGRNFIVAETRAYGIDAQAGTGTLQWGRNFIVAETLKVSFSVWLFRIASMGPQLYRCGN